MPHVTIQCCSWLLEQQQYWNTQLISIFCSLHTASCVDGNTIKSNRHCQVKQVVSVPTSHIAHNQTLKCNAAGCAVIFNEQRTPENKECKGHNHDDSNITVLWCNQLIISHSSVCVSMASSVRAGRVCFLYFCGWLTWRPEETLDGRTGKEGKRKGERKEGREARGKQHSAGYTDVCSIPYLRLLMCSL